MDVLCAGCMHRDVETLVERYPQLPGKRLPGFCGECSVTVASVLRHVAGTQDTNARLRHLEGLFAICDFEVDDPPDEIIKMPEAPRPPRREPVRAGDVARKLVEPGWVSRATEVVKDPEGRVL